MASGLGGGDGSLDVEDLQLSAGASLAGFASVDTGRIASLALRWLGNEVW